MAPQCPQEKVLTPYLTYPSHSPHLVLLSPLLSWLQPHGLSVVWALIHLLPCQAFAHAGNLGQEPFPSIPSARLQI